MILSHSEKGLLYSNECVRLGSKFFLFREGSCSKVAWCAGKQTGSKKSRLPCKRWLNIFNVYPVPLMLTPVCPSSIQAIGFVLEYYPCNAE